MKDNLKHQTIKTYLSAVRHMHIVAGKGDSFREDMPLLEYTMRGIKGDQARNSESDRRPNPPNEMLSALPLDSLTHWDLSVQSLCVSNYSSSNCVRSKQTGMSLMSKMSWSSMTFHLTPSTCRSTDS